MNTHIIAAIEIEGNSIEVYHSVLIRQKFNAHHEFSIRTSFESLENSTSFNIENSHQFIGKLVIIKLKSDETGAEVFEFRGLICEICLEQTDNFSRIVVLTGYSPTILLENGSHLNSFSDKSLKEIANKVAQPLADLSIPLNISPKYSSTLKYICQYKESGFHFLNRLSADFGEWLYFDGKEFFFGKPSSSPTIDLLYGGSVTNIRLTLRILPLQFKNYSYLSKKDEIITEKAPSSVSGLDDFGNKALKSSHEVFSKAIQSPLKSRVDSQSDLKEFVKRQKEALASGLQAISGSSDNTSVVPGTVANVKLSLIDGTLGSRQQDGGKYVITSVEHYLSENGKYFNTFEGVPAGVETMPVNNVIEPIAEPQVAHVTDNKDPDNMGRVKVQMLWQQADNLTTDWIRVMTPDAGGGKGGAKNRGLVVIPETGDQVVVGFRYNDPNRPFVMGSFFQGKTGGGGGGGNKTKSLTALSGATIILEGDAINVIDAAGNSVKIDGGGNIEINCSAKITLTTGSSSLTMDSGGNIELSGTDIKINGTTVDIEGSSKAVMHSTASSLKTEGAAAELKGVTTEVSGDASTKVKAPSVSVDGDAVLNLKGGGVVNLSSDGLTNVKGSVVNLN